MFKVIDELNTLHLDSLSDEWVQASYYSEFLEFGDIPSEYESILESVDIKTLFQSIIKSFDDWLNTTNSEDEKSWATLSNHVIHEKLLAIIAYYIDYGGKNILTKEYRNNALLASRLYYKLLLVPGYKAYHIYHSQLFAHSLVCLGFPKTMCENEDSYYNSKELTREVNSVIRELRHFVFDLQAIIKTLQLSPNDMNFEDILSNLVDITGGAIVNKLNVDKIELANISRVIYEMIDVLICEVNGDPNKNAIQLLFKCILPKLIAASVDCKNANNLVRASYVTYSGLLLSKYGKSALSGYTILLQHLCYTLDGLERAEVRSARVSLVIGLMSLLPQKSYRNIVKWLIKLSTTAKVSHRHIAMEMLSKLLSNEPEENKSKETTSEKEISDNASPPTTEQQSQTVATDVETQDKLEDNTENQHAASMSTDDESSQELPITQKGIDDHEMTEEEVEGLLHARAHTVPLTEVLRAVYERVTDVSGTLRTRALVLLAECIASDRLAIHQAVEELNGNGAVSRLMAAGARCVSDERAAVRRAAVTLLQRLLARYPNPPPTDLGILVSLCRDASILVRSAAITALGELVIQSPSDTMIDAFLSGPMHQLSDPENKVQEQVVTLLQQILLDRLQKYETTDVEDPLPWMFLAGITRHNMRRHLQKACTLLAKNSNSINHRLVDMLSTHLGAACDDRDLQCLVLLTSIARLVDYSDISFVLDYYYKLADDTKSRDARLLPLALELASVWARWAAAAARVALRHHLVQRLASGDGEGCRIACAALAAQLDPDNLQWATELMQLSEQRALSGTGGGELEEWMRAADLSLVAPVPPSPGLLKLFLDALTDPPPEWCEAQRGACVAGAGRLCVRSREAAAAAAPRLAALLHHPAAPLAARLNALHALTDICTRYTCIVEPLLGAVCGCVEASAPAPLRRAAARALTRLLLAGFLRLRTPLYYRYCALLADEDHDVREPAEYYVTSCLTADAIYHHFVDCVLHYNKEDSAGISFDARQLIYDVMLQRLSLVQKLNVQCRLAREVLQHAADSLDEHDDLPPALHAALLDAITLLCGPRMKLPKKPQNTGDADIEDLHERVTTNIVSHKMKRTVAEVVVPAVLQLYARMGPRGGQLAVYLVRIATDLLNDYRHEIEELIENDEELVERVQQFQETIGLAPPFGNTRNLVTASAPPEPDTPRAPRRRPRVPDGGAAPRSYKKRALRI
ncbi:condensin-2 complex subunit D3-like isoform X2 [Galleria mellonella]|uniref:Condensin-2 complex subunit D3-like isoform X2 n=1 Tax=Galleria mellonella TaxID=7137 RepID=A0ABM3MXZ1_GALME|nr:condensin-2 complex subunit D3-like isoform X2 [Galleria mellonella]